MPRPLRDHSAGLRHIICRGNRGQAIVDDDFDRERFLVLLGKVAQKYHWRVVAYCLMTNHVHLLVEVTAGTISRGMQLLNGQYAAAYNVRHGWKGHLFEGRFRSILVEDEAHALEDVRYIPDNPRRAGVVRRAEDVGWRWSSYRQILGLERPRPFLDVSWTLRLFGLDRPGARMAYADFVRVGGRMADERRAGLRAGGRDPRPPRSSGRDAASTRSQGRPGSTRPVGRAAGSPPPATSPTATFPPATTPSATSPPATTPSATSPTATTPPGTFPPATSAPARHPPDTALEHPSSADTSRGQTRGRVPPGRVPDD